MKKYITGLFLGLSILVIPNIGYAQVAPMTDVERASIIAEIKAELVILIAQLQIAIQEEIRNQVATQIASSTPIIKITQPTMTIGAPAVGSTATIGTPINGTVPFIISTQNYVGGVARVKGQGADYGVSWEKGSGIPQFEGLVSGDYEYSIKLYDRPYQNTHMGKDKDTISEESGTFTIK